MNTPNSCASATPSSQTTCTGGILPSARAIFHSSVVPDCDWKDPATLLPRAKATAVSAWPLVGHVALAMVMVLVKEPRSRKGRRIFKTTLTVAVLAWSLLTTVWLWRRRGLAEAASYVGMLLLVGAAWLRLRLFAMEKPGLDVADAPRRRWFGVVYVVCVLGYFVATKVVQQRVLGDRVQQVLVVPQADKVLQGTGA